MPDATAFDLKDEHCFCTTSVCQYCIKNDMRSKSTSTDAEWDVTVHIVRDSYTGEFVTYKDQPDD